MCSILDNDDGEVQHSMEDEKMDKIDGHKCRKCDVNTAAIRLRINDFYCKNCFLLAATHKFRATLGKSKIVKPSDTILVAYSGDSRSTMLLHLIKAGMHKSVYKRLVFKIKVLYIDEGILNYENIDKRQQNAEEVDKTIKGLGFSCFFLSLDNALDKTTSFEVQQKDDYCSNFDKIDKDKNLHEILNKLSSKTSEIDFIKKLRNQLILIAAKKLRCTKVFVGDDLHSLAVDILSNVSLGRGSQLSSDIEFIDQRDPDVMILRPLKDFSKSEVEFYMKIHGLTAIITENAIVSKKNNAYSSIQELTEQFVTELEARYSGTVSTIYRTGEKMSTDSIEKNKNETNNCIFCNGLIDYKPLDKGIFATDAIMFSKMISTQRLRAKLIVSNDETKKENIIKCENYESSEKERNRNDCSEWVNHCDGDYKNRESNDNDNLSREKNISSFLCYGCKLIFQPYLNQKTVPDFILKKCEEKRISESLKKHIQDCLL